MRRHGDARQEGITKAHLRPYVQAVQNIIRRNPDSRVWTQLEAAWGNVVRDAQDGLREADSGRPFIAWAQTAEAEIARLASAVTARDVVETVCAVYIMAEQEPRRFVGDRGFLFQLARRVRGLNEANAGVTWDQKSQRSKRVYRDLPPRATEHFAELLVAALGAPALHLSRTQAAQGKAAREARAALYGAIGELK